MGSHGIKDQVAIIGMGCTRFGERWDTSTGIKIFKPHILECVINQEY